MSSRKPGNLDKFETRLKSGEYYEAHQALKHIFARLVKQGQIEEALDAMVDGATKLQECDQHSSASDLGVQMLEEYKQRKVPVDDVSRGLAFHIDLNWRKPDLTSVLT